MSDEVSIDQFHTVPALKGLTPAELDVVDTITFSVALKPGQTLFKEGDPGDGMYVIVSGSVEVTKKVDEGARWQIAQHGPGVCFGEMALLGNQARAATCTALEPTLLLKVPYKEFSALLKQNNIAALKMKGGAGNEPALRLLRYNGSAWVNVTGSRDAVNHTITSTPLTAALPGIAMKFCGRRKPFVFEVRDLWPELPRALGMKNPAMLTGMSALEWLAYHCADACVGLSPGIVEGTARPRQVEPPVKGGHDRNPCAPGEL